jgi:heme exporter protein D
MKRSWSLFTFVAVGVIVYILVVRNIQSVAPRTRMLQSFLNTSPVFSRETFVSKTCPDKTRSDGPCLMEF